MLLQFRMDKQVHKSYKSYKHRLLRKVEEIER